MLNVNNYSKLFLNGNGVISRTYTRSATEDNYNRIAVLGGSEIGIDTPLEISLLSYTAGVIDVRPVEANAILPANDPKLSGKKLGAAVLKELTELKFLDPSNTAAIGRYEGMLKFISDKNGVSRAEIESYYRQGIGALVAETVDAEFNKVSFILDAVNRTSYSTVLTRNAQNQYILSYERLGTIYTPISGISLENLLAKVSKSFDFNQASVDQVRSQAALIPAVRLGRQSLDEIKVILTNFYLSPNTGTYNAVKEVYALYTNARLTTGEAIFEKIRLGYVATLTIWNEGLARKVVADAQPGTYTTLTTAQQRRLVSVGE
jgi:hypothetical protein